MPDTVVFLGAGATKSCGGPETNEILPKIHEHAAKAENVESLGRLKEFLEQEFHVREGAPEEHYPSLPLVMSLIDTALDRRQDFNERWDLEAMNDLRQQIELGIWEVLEGQLEHAPTNNHWLLFDLLFPAAGEDPCVISTNYDLIADATLMFLSESRPEAGAEARPPDYRCSLTLLPDAADGATSFGTLLKLHGSLNWRNCRNCRRLQLGVTSAKLFLKIIQRLADPDVEKRLEPGGDACPECGTRLRPLLIAPTHMKDYRNPHVTRVWYEAERVLRAARRVVFVGYSLPEDDVEVVYLLKRSLARPGVTVTVIVEDKDRPDIEATDHPV